MAVVVACVGVFGTLSAALVTQALAHRAEAERRSAEDRSRWLADRLRVNAQFLAGALSLERDLWSAAAQLDRDDRQVRMPGYTTILLTPEDGIPGVLEAITREILVDALEDAFRRLDTLEEVAAEIALVSTTEEVAAARALHESLWDAAGGLEAYLPFDVVADAVLRCRTARDQFTRAARLSLRTDGQSPPFDARPRSADSSSLAAHDVESRKQEPIPIRPPTTSG